MAAREFRGAILNQWDNPLVHIDDEVDSGEWQEPWLPSKIPGAGRINHNEQGEWRSESDGIMTGTSGWALWGVRVLEIAGFNTEADDHFEFVRVNWSVPWIEDNKLDITFAVFRSDPREPFLDPRPPVLEIVGTFLSQDGSEPALAQAAEIAPYVFTLPWSFFTNPSFNTHPRAQFTVRRRVNTQVHSLLTFPTGVPSRQQMAMQNFRHRAETAGRISFVGGFPNFYEATHGLDRVGGTVFVKQAAAEWRDIPLVELGNVALGDFSERMRATNTYASQNGFVGGFPTFFHADYGRGIVCGTVLLKSEGAEWRDIPLSELGSPALDDFEARFRATQDYASRNGFVGGFPNLFHAQAVVEVDPRTGRRRRDTVCGTVLLKPGFAEWRDVLLFRGPA